MAGFSIAAQCRYLRGCWKKRGVADIVSAEPVVSNWVTEDGHRPLRRRNT